jgi:hypothetical protein
MSRLKGRVEISEKEQKRESLEYYAKFDPTRERMRILTAENLSLKAENMVLKEIIKKTVPSAIDPLTEIFFELGVRPWSDA